MNRVPYILVILAIALLTLGHATAQGPPDDAGPPDNTPPSHAQTQNTPNEETERTDETDEPRTDATDQATLASTSTNEHDTPNDAPTDPISTDETIDEANPTDPTDDDATNTNKPTPSPDPLPEKPAPIQDTLHERGSITAPPTGGPLDQALQPGEETPTTQSANTPSTPTSSTGWLLPGLFMFGIGALATVTLRSPTTPPTEHTQEQNPRQEPKSEEETIFQPQPGIEGILLLGKNAIDQGDQDAAIGWFETAIALKPNLQTAHFCLGLCLDDAGRLDQAQEALKHAHELEPRDPLARYAHASVLARQGETTQALHHVHHIVRTLPALTETMLNDEEFTPLHDHPRFLALIGQL